MRQVGAFEVSSKYSDKGESWRSPPTFCPLTLTLREAARGERAVSKKTRNSAPTHTREQVSVVRARKT